MNSVVQILEQLAQVRNNLTATGAPFELSQKDTPRGQVTTYKNAPKTLADVLRSVRRDDDACFLVYEDDRWSFARFYQACDGLARWLHSQGVKPGDTLAIAMRNRPEWAVAFVASAMIGAVPAPLNSFGTGEELVPVLDKLQPVMLFADRERFKRLLHERDSFAYPIVCTGNSPLPENIVSFNRVIKTIDGDIPVPQLTDHDPALILFTSGASDHPKAAVSSQLSVCQALYNIDYISALSGMTSPDAVRKIMAAALPPVLLTAVPLFHVSGLHAQLLTALRTGRRLIFMRRWTTECAIDLMRKEQVTQFNGAPSMVMQLLRQPGFTNSELPGQLAGLGFGGAGIPASAIDNVLSSLPDPLIGIGFGMTETNGVASAVSGELFRLKPEASGVVSPIMQVRTCSLDGQVLADGETGEIQLQGVSIMDHYHGEPETTAEAFTDDGWLKTGDLGYVDDDGYLFIVDRLKDVINRAGENIAAAEVESCLLQHEQVLQAAVLGVPDDETGEAVVAAVHVKNLDTVSEKDLKRFAAEHIATYKIPSRIKLLAEELPHNPSGKLLKVEIKKTLFA